MTIRSLVTYHAPHLSLDQIYTGLRQSGPAGIAFVNKVEQILSNAPVNLRNSRTHPTIVLPPYNAQRMSLARSVEPSLQGLPPTTTMYQNYVIGIYKSAFLGVYGHEGLVMRMSEPFPASAMEDSRGAKHKQLAAKDLQILFAGVIVNHPTKGVLVNPKSGTWDERKSALFRTYRWRVNYDTHATLDLLNVVFTVGVLMHLRQQTWAPQPVFVSDVVGRPLRITNLNLNQCVNSYIMKFQGMRNLMNSDCLD